jgi:predicted transcriptional regulator
MPKTKEEFDKMLTEEQMKVAYEERKIEYRYKRHSQILKVLGNQAMNLKEIHDSLPNIPISELLRQLHRMLDGKLINIRYEPVTLRKYYAVSEGVIQHKVMELQEKMEDTLQGKV